MKKLTQADRLYNHLSAGGKITSLEAFNLLGITQLSARVIDLERAGHNIKHDRIKVMNRFGEQLTVTQYSMEKSQ